MKRLVVVLVLAMVAALGLAGCTPMVAPPSVDEAFWGTWVNEDPNTGGITRIEIAPWTVHMWGSCEPTDCDWGETTYAIHEDELRVVWDQGFVLHVQILEIMPGGWLEVETVSYFTDGSGTMAMTERFLREIVIQ